MTARILQFPPFVVRLAEEDEAWLVTAASTAGCMAAASRQAPTPY
jgi:hypothetical protein